MTYGCRDIPRVCPLIGLAVSVLDSHKLRDGFLLFQCFLPSIEIGEPLLAAVIAETLVVAAKSNEISE